MIPQQWTRRLAALGTAGLSVLVIASIAAVVGDIVAVNTAKASAPLSAPATTRVEPPSTRALRPLIQSRTSAPQPAVAGFLNVRLGDLGLLVSAAQVTSLRPIGHGLQLAEVRVTGSGDIQAIASVANWVAVNREAVRLTSLSVDQGQEGRGQVTLVLLMVIA